MKTFSSQTIRLARIAFAESPSLPGLAGKLSLEASDTLNLEMHVQTGAVSIEYDGKAYVVPLSSMKYVQVKL